MIPKRLYIKKAIGIKKGLNKEELEIDFTQFSSGIVGIVGDTGIGKSVIIEMCTPYLKLITRDGNIQSHFYGSDALKEFEFEFNGKTYLSRFIIDATKNKVKPYLYEIKDGKEIVLNDKISEYNSVVEKLFGSFDMFVHSVFAPQGDFPIISLSDAELKKLFINLFNLDKYKDIYLPYIKQKYTEIDNQIRVEKLMIEKYDEDIKQEDDIKSNITVLKKEIEQNKKGLEVASVEREELVSKIKKLEKELDEHRHLIELKRTYTEQLEQAKKAIVDFESNIKQKITAIEANLSSSRRYRNELKERLESEQKRFTRFRRIVDNEHLIIENKNNIDKLRTKINELNEKISEQKEIKNKIAFVKQEINSFNSKIASLQKEIDSLSKQTSVIDEVPCAGTPINSQCKLLANAYKYKDIIEENNKEIEKIKSDVLLKESLLENLTESLNDSYEKELVEAQNALNTLIEQKWEKLYDELPQAKNEVEQFNSLKEDIEKKIAQTIQSDEDITQKINDINAKAEIKRKELNDNLKAIESKLKSISITDPQIINRDISELNFKLVTLDGEIKAINAKIVELQANIKAYQNALERIEKLKVEKEELVVKIKEYLDTYDAYKTIEKFLKDIPVLEIKSLSTQLKEYANDLLSGLFDYSLTIDFITEMEKASGKGTKDVFKVLIYNNGDEMLGKNLSGGQKQIVDMAIRMAIETLFYNVSTKKIQTVFMDESDSGLDTERAIKFWDMVEKTHQMNNRHYTFIVTHRTEIKNNLDQVIDLNAWRN